MKADFLTGLLLENGDLSAKFIAALEERLRSEIYKPHQIIQAAGNIENRLFYIESGFARNYFYDDFGTEHTVRFWEPGNILFSYQGYYKISSDLYIEVMADSRFISLAYDKLQELEQEFPETKLLIRHFILKFQQEDFERLQMISLPAEARYRLLRKNSNHLFSKVSAKIIASFLHLSRETLSRYMAKR